MATRARTRSVDSEEDGLASDALLEELVELEEQAGEEIVVVRPLPDV
jgi:hypothetical protein